MSQFGVLKHLCRLSGEETPVQLASITKITKSAMTNILDHSYNKEE